MGPVQHWRLALAGAVGSQIAIGVSAFVLVIGRAPASDFLAFRASGAAWLGGGDLYAAHISQGPQNLNAPALALLFAPLSLPPMPVALALWEVVVLASLAGAAAIISRTVGRPFLVVAAFLAVMHPTLLAIAIGQMGLPLLLLLTVAWAADRRGAPRLAGLMIGAAVAVKVFVALLLVALCLRRAWRSLAWAAIGAAAVVAVGLGVDGLDGYRGWIAALWARRHIEFPLNASILGFVARTVPDPALSVHVAVGASLVAAAVIVWLLSRVRHDVDRTWGGALAGSLLLSPLGWAYYLPILAPPLLALWSRGSKLATLVLALLALPFSYLPLSGWTVGALLTGTLAVSLAACALGNAAVPSSIADKIEERPADG